MKFEEALKGIKERFINKDASNIEDISIQFNQNKSNWRFRQDRNNRKNTAKSVLVV